MTVPRRFRHVRSSGPWFDRIVAIDYSGAGEDDQPLAAIRAFAVDSDHRGEATSDPVEWRSAGCRHWSRRALCDALLTAMQSADMAGQRLLIGIDHQTGWPMSLWRTAGLGDCDDWRTALMSLDRGDPLTGRPPLDIPARFCGAFNRWADERDRSCTRTHSRDFDDVHAGVNCAAVPVRFWSPLRRIAAAYGTASTRPDGLDRRVGWRHVEHAAAAIAREDRTLVRAVPKPADAVGGQGEGVVGGQTICGLAQLARLLTATQSAGVRLRCWPHDGLDSDAPSYDGAHVLIEIYPALFRPRDIPRSDAADAAWSARGLCALLRQARDGSVPHPLGRAAIRRGLQMMIRPTDCGTAEVPFDERVICLEGWIAGIGCGIAGPRWHA